MQADEVGQKVEVFIRTELLAGQARDPIKPDEELLKTGIVDSIGFFRLLSFITEQFGVKHGDDELVPDNFRTIDTIARRVIEKLKAEPTKGT